MISISDIAINFITGAIVEISGKLPAEFLQFPISDFDEKMLDLFQNFLDAFNALNFIFPIWLIVGVIQIIIISELILFGFKFVVFLVNMLRGSGA